MRMDRYDESIESSKKTRTNKNQELYTDVYLNNAYVDMNEINDVVTDNEVKEEKVIDFKDISYQYKEKNYDIKEIIENAIENNPDSLKRSIEHTTDIENIIKSINENHRENEKNDNLLSELLPDSDTTTIMEPLDTAITNTGLVDTSVIHKDEMSNEIKDEIENEDVKDESFKDEVKSNKKIIFIVIGIILLIGIVLGILIWKDVIKF